MPQWNLWIHFQQPYHIAVLGNFLHNQSPESGLEGEAQLNGLPGLPIYYLWNIFFWDTRKINVRIVAECRTDMLI